MTVLPAPESWRRIAPILEQALDLPPDQRAAFLDRACAEDPALRAEIEGLLAADSKAGAFLDTPVDLSAVILPPGPEPDPARDAEALEGTMIGPYRVVREIGRGGMGVVYEAEQARPRRPVALKVILGGRHADPEAIRMFQRETDSLARLKHPFIASIYESGSTEEGQHFFAMELVQGRTLTDFLDESGAVTSGPDLRRRLALFRKICAAVAYAHQRGVIHRDLKPSNILVLPPAGTPGTEAGRAAVSGSTAAADEAPDIKVLDFGLARITDPDAAAASAVTAIGHIQGTLPYMSPEQVRGRRDEVDIRTDVYSLGVILYRMLTGRLPYDLEGAEFPEVARIICEQAPRPLRAPAGGRLKLDRDLAIVVLKALEKEPGRRYQTVGAFEEDIGRYLGGQPILARPPSAAYQLRKLMERHKLPFAAAGALVILIVGFAVVMTLLARRIAAERDRANREATTAREVSDFLGDLFRMSHPNEARGNALTVREVLDKGVEKIGRELSGEPEVQARLMFTMGMVYSSLGLYREADKLLAQSVETRRRLLGEENPETLEAMDGLAMNEQLQSRIPAAEKLYRQLVEVRSRLQGEDHPQTLMELEGLAWVYRSQGRFSEEEKAHRRVLEARRRTLGEEDRSTLLSMSELAGCYSFQRRYDEAAALFGTALEKQRRVLGDDHPNTLGSMFSLAGVDADLGRYAEAEALFRESLERMRRVLGEDHPLTLSATNDFATMLDGQGRPAEAEPLYRETLQKRRRILGEDHPDTLSSMANLANVCFVQGRYAEAEALFLEALEKDRRLQGENHPDTQSVLYNLGCMSALRGDRAAALRWLDQCVTHGWPHAEQMANDSDLKSLRGDPAFDALVARARKNSAK